MNLVQKHYRFRILHKLCFKQTQHIVVNRYLNYYKMISTAIPTVFYTNAHNTQELFRNFLMSENFAKKKNINKHKNRKVHFFMKFEAFQDILPILSHITEHTGYFLQRVWQMQYTPIYAHDFALPIVFFLYGTVCRQTTKQAVTFNLLFNRTLFSTVCVY